MPNFNGPTHFKNKGDVYVADQIHIGSAPATPAIPPDLIETLKAFQAILAELGPNALAAKTKIDAAVIEAEKPAPNLESIGSGIGRTLALIEKTDETVGRLASLKDRLLKAGEMIGPMASPLVGALNSFFGNAQ